MITLNLYVVGPLRVGERVVSFAGPQSVLSNLAYCHIGVMYKGHSVVFFSVEQAYQWLKLTWLGYPYKADALLAIRDPFEIMACVRRFLGDQERQFPWIKEWKQRWRDEYAVRVLTELTTQKLKFCKPFCEILADNANKTFIERTADPFWGCGMNHTELANCSEARLIRSRGRNMMGRILKKISSIAVHVKNGGSHPAERLWEHILDY